MNSRALIKETLKYLETNENGEPKYRFEVYKNGLAQFNNRAISMFTSGKIDNVFEENQDERMPVSIYTIGDIFNTLQQTTGDIITDIKAMPGTLENIKVSLKELGFSAVETTIETLKSAVMAIEVVQTINDVYRIAKPIVEKVRDIATIMFYFPSSALVAQDVVQYLSRLAFSTAKNYFTRLFEIMMDTPVFAIYENDDTVNLSKAYSTLSDDANAMLSDIALSRDAFGKIMAYANSESEKRVYEPSYSNLGIAISENIVDVFHDYHTRKIFIASEHKIYELDEDYNTDEIFEDEDVTIEKIFYYDDAVYYITSDNKVYETDSSTPILTGLTNPKVIYSDPVYLYNQDGNKLIEVENFTAAHTLSDDIIQSTFDFNNKILYYISSSKKLYRVLQNSDGTFSEEKILTFDVNDTITGMAFFNNMLYIAKNNYVTKVNAGMSFSETPYSYSQEQNSQESIIYADGNLATNGTYFYEQNDSILSNQRRALGTINCVTKKEYEERDYFVATGGNKVFVTKDYPNCATSWFSKELQYNVVGGGDTINSLSGDSTPDTAAGCLWFSDPDDYFIAYSQKNVYVVGPDYIDDIFDLPPDEESLKMPYKEFAEFIDWWDSEKQEPTPTIRVTKKINVGNCIITGMRVINNSVYIALFNPLYNESSQNVTVKTGIYKVIISRHDANIDYSNPVYVAGVNNPKIYSFNYIDNTWYYTDGKNLYNITTATNNELDLEDANDRALTITSTTVDNKEKLRILTSQEVLDSVETKDYGRISSSVNYSGENLSIASTKNTLMIADSNFVYNIVDNGKNDIVNEMFQICYKKTVSDFSLLQSCNAAFIVSDNIIKKVPLYDSITSINYGCGYYTDTAPNKWYGAAPYYFASNVLNNKGKNAYTRNVFIKSFKENFKVELEKLLKHIPDAFVSYTTEKLVEGLRKTGIEIDGDDGQIAELLINSVASTTANSIGMYVHDKFMEKLGDDNTYETFAENVYQACLADSTNNMTKDFYDIFEELYYSTLVEAFTSKDFGQDGMSAFLLRYYQNHKAEWAKSMTDLIDVDTVDPDIYEVPLKTSQKLKQTTYRFNYTTGAYEYEYMPSISKIYETESGYLRNGQFYDAETGGNIIDQRVFDISTDSWSINGETVCYKNPEDNKFYKFRLEDFVLTEDTTPVTGTTYYARTSESYTYSLATSESEEPYFRAEYAETNDTSVVSGKDYYSKSGGASCYILQPSTEATLPDDAYFEKQEYQPTTDTEVASTQVGGIKTIYVYDDETISEITRYSVSSATEDEKGEYIKVEESQISYYYLYDPASLETRYIVEFAEDANGKYFSYDLYESEKIYSKTYYTPSYEQVQSEETIVSSKQYYIEDYVKTQDALIDPNKTYYEYLDFDGYSDELKTIYVVYESGMTDARYDVTFSADINGEYVNITGTSNYAYSPYSSGTKYKVVSVTANQNGNYCARSVPKNEYFTYNPNASTKYSITFSEMVDTYFNEYETYYVIEDGVYKLAEDLDLQYGPFYVVSEFILDENGEYELKTFDGSESGFKQVASPVTDNLSRYYESTYSKLQTPSQTDIAAGKIYKIEYIPVEEPNNTDISTYYEKEESFIVARNLNYTQNGEVINDRKLYKMANMPLTYTKITLENTDNPKELGLYEISSYSQVESGSSLNPVAEGLYVRTYNATSYRVVTPTQESNPKKNGWYTFTLTYSNLYDDGKVYINLAATEITSSFPELDDAWHNAFYTSVTTAKASVTDKDSAITALDNIAYPDPGWQWKALLNEAVTTLYIPTQGEQYRTIIRESNMYPIQWQELPSKINRTSFDYALTTLLYMIKQRLLTNITILVDGGQVKCYSCVDASTVIQKIINRNNVIWRNQLRIAKNAVEKAKSLTEIKAAFDMVEAYDQTLYLLENILIQQSALYAKYIDMLIEEQIINDNETEVDYND